MYILGFPIGEIWHRQVQVSPHVLLFISISYFLNFMYVLELGDPHNK